jgi:imidazolonepropionase-like amidohydrolase
MTPLQAIQAATITAAQLLDMQDQIGDIKPGAFADLIAVKEDPTLKITSLENVGWVMKDGIVWKNGK